MAKTIAIMLAFAALTGLATARYWPVQGGYDCAGKITEIRCEEDANGMLTGISYYNDESGWSSFCSSAHHGYGGYGGYSQEPPAGDKTFAVPVGDSIVKVEACRGGKYGYTTVTFWTDGGESFTCGSGAYEYAPSDYASYGQAYQSYEYLGEGGHGAKGHKGGHKGHKDGAEGSYEGSYDAGHGSYEGGDAGHGGYEGGDAGHGKGHKGHKGRSLKNGEGEADLDHYMKKGSGWGWDSKCQTYESPKQPAWSPRGDGVIGRKGDWFANGGAYHGEYTGKYTGGDVGYGSEGGKYTGGDVGYGSEGGYADEGGHAGEGGHGHGDKGGHWGYTSNKYSKSKSWKSYSAYYEHAGSDGKYTQYYKDYPTYKKHYSEWSANKDAYNYKPGYYYKELYPLSGFKALCDKHGGLYNLYGWCWNHGYVPPPPVDAAIIQITIELAPGTPCPTQEKFEEVLAATNFTGALESLPAVGKVAYENFKCGPGPNGNNTITADIFLFPAEGYDMQDIIDELNAAGVLGVDLCTTGSTPINGQCTAAGITSLTLEQLLTKAKMQAQLLTRAGRTRARRSIPLGRNSQRN